MTDAAVQKVLVSHNMSKYFLNLWLLLFQNDERHDSVHGVESAFFFYPNTWIYTNQIALTALTQWFHYVTAHNSNKEIQKWWNVSKNVGQTNRLDDFFPHPNRQGWNMKVAHQIDLSRSGNWPPDIKFMKASLFTVISVKHYGSSYHNTALVEPRLAACERLRLPSAIFFLMGLEMILCFHVSHWCDLWPSRCFCQVQNLWIYHLF